MSCAASDERERRHLIPTSGAEDEGQRIRSVSDDVADGRRPGTDKDREDSDREDSRRNFRAESFEVSC